MSRRLSALLTIADVEAAAARRLPVPIFDMIAGGSGDEVSLRRNRTAFENVSLLPHACIDVRDRDLSTMVLGQRISMPLMVGPTGFQRMAHRDAELAVARAAGAAETIFGLSSISSYPFGDIGAAATGPAWFQLYPSAFQGKLPETLARIREAGFYALCITVDSAVSGIRERDARHRITLPLRFSPRLAFEIARRPGWAIDFLRGGIGRGSHGMGPRRVSLADAATLMQKSAASVTLDDLATIRKLWNGPLVVKGILRGADCPPLLKLGADGIVVSNHGARFLDTVPASISVLPEVVDAVNDQAEVFLDGGVRRGVDVIKALAMGARACLVGRPYLYGLAAGGEAGVARVLEIFRLEIDRALALVGARRPSELDRSFLRFEDLPR
jgi:isopentenyl diphosphate isomerase/L-lactate dehydrogenase-like FMN-dependent dehydrogenase